MNPFDKKVLDEVARKKRNIDSDKTLNTLCQNKEQWKGITIFELAFNGVPIKFITLKDAKAIDEKTTETSRQEAVKIVEDLKEKVRKMPNRDDKICCEGGVKMGILDGGGVGCFAVIKEIDKILKRLGGDE